MYNALYEKEIKELLSSLIQESKHRIAECEAFEKEQVTVHEAYVAYLIAAKRHVDVENERAKHIRWFAAQREMSDALQKELDKLELINEYYGLQKEGAKEKESVAQ